MLSSILRTSARRTTLARRHAATKASDAVKPSSDSFPPASTLPPAKMRALISLYHQADRFITPENLSDAIDDAFITQRELRSYALPEMSLGDLRYELEEMRELSKIGDGKEMRRRTQNDATSQDGRAWSSKEDERANEVKHALYGLQRVGRPGLEVLEEEHERIQAYIRKDKETAATLKP